MKNPEIDIDDPAVYEFLSSLTEDERWALELKLQGHKKREIADKMGKGRNVITRVFDAVKGKAKKWGWKK